MIAVSHYYVENRCYGMYLDGKERLLSVFWVLRVEAGQHFQVGRTAVIGVKSTFEPSSVLATGGSE